MELLNERIIALAKEYADQQVPFEHLGFSRNGCDCVGLLVGIARELGYLKDYRPPEYPFQWAVSGKCPELLTNELKRFGTFINRNTRPGDIAVMNICGQQAHCGIIVSPGVMVHTHKRQGKCGYGILKNSQWSARWSVSLRVREDML